VIRLRSSDDLRYAIRSPLRTLLLAFPVFLLTVCAIKDDRMDPEYLRYLGAVQVVFSGVKTFISYENKLPVKFADLAESPYLAVRPENIENPYKKEPMTFPKAPVLGDIAWVYKKGTLKLITTSRTKKRAKLQHSEMTYDKQNVDKWGSEARSIGYGHDDFNYVMSLTRDDRRLYLSCFQVSFAMRNFPFNPYTEDYPATLKGINDDLRYRQFFIYSIWNPYEKREAREVTEAAPGDFILKWVTTPRERMPVLYCFNAKGEPLSPTLRRVFEATRSLERPQIPE
jgi:hypothetical protein